MVCRVACFMGSREAASVRKVVTAYECLDRMNNLVYGKSGDDVASEGAGRGWRLIPNWENHLVTNSPSTMRVERQAGDIA